MPYYPRLTEETRLVKRCRACNEVKPRSEFFRSGKHAPEHYVGPRCKLCETIHARNYSRLPHVKESRKKRFVRDNYNVSIPDVERARIVQNGRCAICHSSSDQGLQIDHDHKTGTFRGLLCGLCNRMIGLAGDRPDVLDSASRYLRLSSSHGLTESREKPTEISRGFDKRFGPKD